MELTGSRDLLAPPDLVWARLFNLETLAASIPGCETLTQDAPDRFTAAVRVRIGPVSARFQGTVTIADADPPDRCTISGSGNGGIAGFAKGSAEVTLTRIDAGTRLAFRADAQVGGKLAALGNRLIASSAQKLSDEFFDRFAAAVSGTASAAAD